MAKADAIHIGFLTQNNPKKQAESSFSPKGSTLLHLHQTSFLTLN